jgi:His-Xaa-Ser system protein HxsD
MDVQFENSDIYFKIDLRIYPNIVVQKCFYWYTSDYEVSYKISSPDSLEVKLVPKSDLKLEQDTFIAKIAQDLNDFLLREVVSNETRTIRELIIAKAFANFEEEDSNFQFGEISDPVGFNTPIL